MRKANLVTAYTPRPWQLQVHTGHKDGINGAGDRWRVHANYATRGAAIAAGRRLLDAEPRELGARLWPKRWAQVEHRPRYAWPPTVVWRGCIDGWQHAAVIYDYISPKENP